MKYTSSEATDTEGMRRPTSVLIHKQGGSTRANPRVVCRSQATFPTNHNNSKQRSTESLVPGFFSLYPVAWELWGNSVFHFPIGATNKEQSSKWRGKGSQPAQAFHCMPTTPTGWVRPSHHIKETVGHQLPGYMFEANGEKCSISYNQDNNLVG